MRDKFAFEESIETDNKTGDTLAVYLRVRKGRVAVTKEHVEGTLFADYDRKGQLLGLEVLAPCKVTVLMRVAKDSEAKRFVKKSIPYGMLAA